MRSFYFFFFLCFSLCEMRLISSLSDMHSVFFFLGVIDQHACFFRAARAHQPAVFVPRFMPRLNFVVGRGPLGFFLFYSTLFSLLRVMFQFFFSSFLESPPVCGLSLSPQRRRRASSSLFIASLILLACFTCLFVSTFEAGLSLGHPVEATLRKKEILPIR